MDANEYQAAARATQNPELSSAENLLNATLGLVGGAGEFADHMKKALFHDHPRDEEHLVKELGDILWYVCQACDALDVQLQDVMQVNIDKLRARYPGGFSSDRSRNRAG